MRWIPVVCTWFVVVGFSGLAMAQGAAPAETPAGTTDKQDDTPALADADTAQRIPDSPEGKPDATAPASDAPGALPQPPVDPDSQGTVQYAAVDAATHRVFAIGSVGLVMVDADGLEVPLALPHSGHGTGFAVGPDGFIVTAGHVADDAVHLVIRLPGEGGFRSAQVAYRDEDQDVAILWVDDPIVPLQLASPENRLRVRQTVYAIGYPLDASRTQAQSARGIVAGQIEDDILQLDISLNPGNSGGPLVDENDQVVGMVVARGDVESGVQGLGIAIATPRIRRALKQAKAKLATGELKPPGQTQRNTAEVVDRLLRLGVFHTVRESNGLSQGFTEKNLEAEITKLASRVADPDLLLYLAGRSINVKTGQPLAVVRIVSKEPGAQDRESAISLLHRRTVSSLQTAAGMADVPEVLSVIPSASSPRGNLPAKLSEVACGQRCEFFRQAQNM